MVIGRKTSKRHKIGFDDISQEMHINFLIKESQNVYIDVHNLLLPPFTIFAELCCLINTTFSLFNTTK